MIYLCCLQRHFQKHLPCEVVWQSALVFVTQCLRRATWMRKGSLRRSFSVFSQGLLGLPLWVLVKSNVVSGSLWHRKMAPLMSERINEEREKKRREVGWSKEGRDKIQPSGLAVKTVPINHTPTPQFLLVHQIMSPSMSETSLCRGPWTWLPWGRAVNEQAECPAFTGLHSSERGPQHLIPHFLFQKEEKEKEEKQYMWIICTMLPFLKHFRNTSS